VPERHEAVVGDIFERLGPIDFVPVAVSVFGPSGDAQLQRTVALELLATNPLGTVSVILPFVAHLQEQGHGTLVVLSSVAASRPRASNFPLWRFEGRPRRLLPFVGRALRYRRPGCRPPGACADKMTALQPAAPLSSTPDAVAFSIIKGIRRDAHTIWAPRSLRPVHWLLRLLPRPVFRRLPF
jgi:decaprenylphospho-beta-D-erythro-pentofuranosid-2-ulose 2-reductase